jgi:hypothetical protein
MNPSRTVRTTAKVRHVGEIEGELDDLIECQPRRGTPVTADFVIGACHRPSGIEKSLRMSKHHLQARPIHHQHDSIEAHLNVVFAALAVSPLDRSPDRLVNPQVRPHCPPPLGNPIQAGGHSITAADPAARHLQKAPTRSTTPARIRTSLTKVGLLALWPRTRAHHTK